MPKLGLRMPPTRSARPPGDVGHPAPPSRCRCCGARCTAPRPSARCRGRDPAALRPLIDTARALVAEGCGAIAIVADCGFLALWQRELQAALPMPV